MLRAPVALENSRPIGETTDKVRELAEVHSRYILSSVCPASSVKGREIGGFLPVKMLVHAKSTSRL